MSIASKLNNSQFVQGGTNAPGFEDEIYICFEEELKFGATLPNADTNTKLISDPILFRDAVAANPAAVPPAPAIPAGGCVKLQITKKKNALKMGAKYEDGYTHYEPEFECIVPQTDENRDFQIELLNGSRLVLFFRDNNGKMRVGTRISAMADPVIDDNNNHYKVKFMFGVRPKMPFFYNGPIPLR